MNQAPILEARHITKVLGQGAGKVVALDDVSLTLFPGEFTLLMGPSGSGKTTLLSVLGCILTPTSGALRVAGEAVASSTPEALAELRRRHFGFVFQSYNLFPTLNALDNVKLALDLRGLSAHECNERARAALDEVGLGHRLMSYPGTLSGGEKQRVAIARALAPAPAIILADEPTSALDTENGAAVMALLAAIAKRDNRTVLAVTHDPRTIAYANRVVRIEDGRIYGPEKTAIHNREESQTEPRSAKFRHKRKRQVYA